MKRLLLASAALAFSSVSVLAADIDQPEPVLATEYDWSGAYIGLQGGGAVAGTATAAAVINGNLRGGLGGILLGYNFQRDNLVFGIDSDYSFGNINATLGVGGVRWRTLGLTRVRAGYAFDRVLPFVTGGLATSLVNVDAGPGFSDDNSFDIGWTAGAGIEYALSKSVRARVQYNYVDLGSENINFNGTVVNVDRGNTHLVRAGVAIKTDAIFGKLFGK